MWECFSPIFSFSQFLGFNWSYDNEIWHGYKTNNISLDSIENSQSRKF